MPIQITCSACGKKLQVGDQYAGRRVSCPGCKTVLTAPGGPAAAAPKPAPASPPPPAPKPAPAAKATPAKPIPAKPAAPPPPEPDPEPAPSDDPFSFGGKPAAPATPSADWGGGEEEAPAPMPWEEPKKPEPKKDKDAPKGKEKDAPKGKKRGKWDDEDDDKPARKSKPARGAAPPDEPEKQPAAAWKAFGGGSGLAKLGLWIEFLGFAAGFGLIGYTAMNILDPAKVKSGEDLVRQIPTQINDMGGPMLLAPFFVGNLLGTLLVLLGRTRMMGVPRTAGVKKVFFGAWCFTVIRFGAAVGAAILFYLSTTEWSGLAVGMDRAAATKSGEALAYMMFAMVAFVAGLPFLILADLSTIPAMAAVGGEIPSAALRRRACTVTFVLQLLVIGYVLAGLVTGVIIAQVDFSKFAADAARSAAHSAAKPDGGLADVLASLKQAVMLELGVVLFAQFVYTLLYASLYAAGKRAVIAAVEAEEAAADADV